MITHLIKMVTLEKGTASWQIVGNIRHKHQVWGVKLQEHIKTCSGWIVFFSAIPPIRKHHSFTFQLPLPLTKKPTPEVISPKLQFRYLSCPIQTQENQVMPQVIHQVIPQGTPSNSPKGSPKGTFTAHVVPWACMGQNMKRDHWHGGLRVASCGIMGRGQYTYIYIYINK